jgi:uncharacterized phage-associated protein
LDDWLEYRFFGCSKGASFHTESRLHDWRKFQTVVAMSYNARKAAQVIAYFASKTDSKRIDILKVIKLVYLADRESIKTYGFPILDEIRVSMPHGPVNSLTYAHIQGEYDLTESGWSQYLCDRSNHQVSISENAPSDWDELSDADIRCLDVVWSRFGHLDKWQIRDWTHSPSNIPEWEDAYGSSLPIPIERIMRAVGVEFGSEYAETIRSFEESDRSFRDMRI